tara:strand:- start:232 stop:636 length:405 start_codon:yes stop_codon:yes gene_type:complete
MKNSIDPNSWGPSGWNFIHYTALGYPDNPTEEDKKNYKIFYQSLQHTLPCVKCSLNYKENLKELPIDKFLGSKEDLFKWTVDIHNMVNNELGKTNLNYEQAFKKYTRTDSNIKSICIILAILFLVLIVSFLFLK